MAERGTCRVCSRVFNLTKSGDVRHHGAKDGSWPPRRCDGAGQEPKEHLRLGRDYQIMDVLRIGAHDARTDCACTHSRADHETPGLSCSRCVWCDEFKPMPWYASRGVS